MQFGLGSRILQWDTFSERPKTIEPSLGGDPVNPAASLCRSFLLPRVRCRVNWAQRQSIFGGSWWSQARGHWVFSGKKSYQNFGISFLVWKYGNGLSFSSAAARVLQVAIWAFPPVWKLSQHCDSTRFGRIWQKSPCSSYSSSCTTWWVVWWCISTPPKNMYCLYIFTSFSQVASAHRWHGQGPEGWTGGTNPWGLFQ